MSPVGCPWTDPYECALAAEREVAGTSTPPASCPVHPRPEGLGPEARAIVAAADRRPNPANWSPEARLAVSAASTAAVAEGVLREDLRGARTLTNRQAVDLIAHVLKDPDWGVGMLEDIAGYVIRTGRSLENPTNEATWLRH